MNGTSSHHAVVRLIIIHGDVLRNWKQIQFNGSIGILNLGTQWLKGHQYLLPLQPYTLCSDAGHIFDAAL